MRIEQPPTVSRRLKTEPLQPSAHIVFSLSISDSIRMLLSNSENRQLECFNSISPASAAPKPTHEWKLEIILVVDHRLDSSNSAQESQQSTKLNNLNSKNSTRRF